MFGIPILLVIVVVAILALGAVALAAVSLFDSGLTSISRTLEPVYYSLPCGGVTGGDKAVRVNSHGEHQVQNAAGYWSI